MRAFYVLRFDYGLTSHPLHWKRQECNATNLGFRAEFVQVGIQDSGGIFHENADPQIASLVKMRWSGARKRNTIAEQVQDDRTSISSHFLEIFNPKDEAVFVDVSGRDLYEFDGCLI